jgi:hypothetical protein
MQAWEPVMDTGTHEIRTFDDGNQDLTHKTNAWYIVARWRGKVRLRNAVDSSVVHSISAWKVE